MVKQVNSILGINGYSRMSDVKFTTYIEWREALIKDSAASLGDAIPFANSIEFLRRQFAGNKVFIAKFFS